MALMRYYSKFKHRPVSFFNPVTGGFYSEKSGVKNLGQATLGDALKQVDTSILLLMPLANGKYYNKQDYDAIEQVSYLKYLSKRQSAKLQYAGHRINIYPITLWFDVKPGAGMKDVINGYRKLREVLNANFQPQKVHNGSSETFPVEILATPSQLGGDLLKRSLPYNQTYEPLPEEEAMIILENMGQGRFETFYHGDSTLEKVYNYDGRWMYASCIRMVPTGRIIHDHVNEVMMTEEKISKKTGFASRGYIPGFYHVEVQIPDDWDHIGLLPVRTSDGSVYPRQAGRRFSSWCTDCELALAIKHGWQIVEVKERILWPETSTDPLHLLTERLKRIRLELAETYPEPIKSFIRGAARNILLQMIGSFRHVAAKYDFYINDPMDLPDYSNDDIIKINEHLYKYTVNEKISSYQKDLCQVHWASWIWGKARRKLAEEALQVPFEHLVALRADAIWTDTPCNFINTGKVGQFKREHLYKDTNFKWPRNNADMRKLVIVAKGHDEIKDGE